MTKLSNNTSAIRPQGDWMENGFLTGKRGGLYLHSSGAEWYASLDGRQYGPARIDRYSDADYLEVDGTAWEYCLDHGEADRLAARGVPVRSIA